MRRTKVAGFVTDATVFANTRDIVVGADELNSGPARIYIPVESMGIYDTSCVSFPDRYKYFPLRDQSVVVRTVHTAGCR